RVVRWAQENWQILPQSQPGLELLEDYPQQWSKRPRESFGPKIEDQGPMIMERQLPEEDWDPRSSIPDCRSWNVDFRNRCQGHFRPLALAENVFRGLGIFRVRRWRAPLLARGKVAPAGTETENRGSKLEDSTRLP